MSYDATNRIVAYDQALMVGNTPVYQRVVNDEKNVRFIKTMALYISDNTFHLAAQWQLFHECTNINLYMHL